MLTGFLVKANSKSENNSKSELIMFSVEIFKEFEKENQCNFKTNMNKELFSYQ